MAIQIHQLNEITTPAMTDYLADDTGTDTGKLSIETLAGAILADYQATFGDDTTDVVSKVTAIATAQATDEANIATLQTDVSGKVDKAGDTMTGNLTISSENAVQRFLKIANSVRNVRWSLNNDGNFGLYDDTNNEWILYNQNGNAKLVTPKTLRADTFECVTKPTVIQAIPAAITSVSVGSWVTVASISIPTSAIYVITGSVIVSGSTGAAGVLRLDTSSGNCRQSFYIPNGNTFAASVADIVEMGGGGTVNLQVYVSGTVNILSGGRLKAVRIV